MCNPRRSSLTRAGPCPWRGAAPCHFISVASPREVRRASLERAGAGLRDGSCATAEAAAAAAVAAAAVAATMMHESSPLDATIPARVYTFIDLSHRSRAMAVPRSTISLLALWASSWAERGWQPFLVSPRDIRGDEHALVVNRTWAAARKVLSPLLDDANYAAMPRAHQKLVDRAQEQIMMRWRDMIQFYSMAAVGGGVLSDTDVVNYDLSPADVQSDVRAAGGDKVQMLEGRKCECSSTCKQVPKDGNVSTLSLRATDALSTEVECVQSTTRTVWEGLVFTANAPAPGCAHVVCKAINNGLSGGSAAAYRRLALHWLGTGWESSRRRR